MNISKWIPIAFEFDENHRNALGQQHLAAQLVALVGRYIVPQKPDSSNINMQFIPEKEILLGNKLENGIQIGLNLPMMEIQIHNPSKNELKTLPLNNKTFEESLDVLKKVLVDEGVNISALKTEQPYELPKEWLIDGKFSVQNPEYFQNISNLRYNTELLLSELTKTYQNSIPVRIWPHHFDTGTYFSIIDPVSGDTTQTIGMGWAIPDGMVNEPYFYISFWSAREFEKPIKVTPLAIGKWLTPDWNGAVLTHSEILNTIETGEQHNNLKDFFTNGIEQIVQFIKSN